MHWHRVLIGALLAGSASSSSRPGNGGASFAPIRELGPSLAASVAGGTIVAARSPRQPSVPTSEDALGDGQGADDDEECLVVLFRSPVVGESGSSKQRADAAAGNLTVTSVFGYQADDNIDAGTEGQRRNNHYHGLSFLPNGPVHFPFLPSATNSNVRILHAPSGLLVAATGFAPDADHLLHVLAGRVLSRLAVYDAPHPSAGTSGKGVDPHRLVREDLSSMMVDAAMSEGSRPLGVQLMVVGQSALARRDAAIGALEMYTVDPSGGWRSCVGRGTAVGRGAERVRASMLRSSRDAATATGTTPENDICGWRGALHHAMMAAIDALEESDDSKDTMDGLEAGARAKYGAMVIFGKSDGARRQISTSRCAAIDPTIVEECYQRCCREVQSLATKS